MKHTINTVLFDFDGVLLDSVADIAAAVNMTLRHFGYSTLSQERICTFIGNGAPTLIERSFEASLAESGRQIDADLRQQLPTILSKYIEYYENNCAVHSSLYAGVAELLQELKKRKIKMGVVSNKPLNLSLIILAHFKIEHFFGVVIGPESTARQKPAPDGLLMALDELNAQAEAALMVGDSASDIQAAKSAGIHSCAIRGMGNVEALLAADADIVVDSIEQLLSNARFRMQ
jgi:phosphoglycolate phosphatase